ncbi:S53 family peptidase [Nakamurella endophytica]|uniref:Kumamolisin n=1 Tax=Nakamurella endophytica TaxID=1748367 RepID=A0A917SL18_9ACTN|nr:S53 family peptidase [Nakamurella endophytica]GGL86127.1 kumamolisin [Nakamurella endophytica]
MNEPSQPRAVVAGSDREPLAGAAPVAPADPDQQATVTVMVRRRSGAAPRVSGPAAPRVSRADFAQTFGADPDDIDAVTRFAAEHGLEVAEADPAARTVRLRGTVAALQSAFAVSLATYEHGDGRYRGREGAVTVPATLGGVVTGVFGLDDRPQVRPRLHQVRPAAVDDSFAVTELASLYDFPTGATGAGQTIAIAEFGGGYRQADLDAFFRGLGLATPSVTAVGVDGADNSPGEDADVEVVLDVEVAGAVAPGAAIAVYFAPNTDQGFIDAVTRAVHDTERDPSVLSISWGGPEEEWTEQTRTAIDEVFEDAAALGVTVLVAAGDHGAADRSADMAGYDGRAHVDFPASSPHATACGGTRIQASGGAITSEVVWNTGDGWATGGGVSSAFPPPDWQTAEPTSVDPPHGRGRGVPDVSGNADSTTGYRIHVNGQDTVVGGTSAVAPLWAGLVALVNQSTGERVGFVNPALYAAPAGTFRDITQGDNGIPASGRAPATPGYPAGTGWDACTGLGSPVGTAVRDVLAAAVTGGGTGAGGGAGSGAGPAAAPGAGGGTAGAAAGAGAYRGSPLFLDDDDDDEDGDELDDPDGAGLPDYDHERWGEEELED